MTLSPGQRLMKISDQLPFTPGTAAHIITGSMNFVMKRSNTTVVEAESVIEVPAVHGSFHHSNAVAQIIRILE